MLIIKPQSTFVLPSLFRNTPRPPNNSQQVRRVRILTPIPLNNLPHPWLQRNTQRPPRLTPVITQHIITNIRLPQISQVYKRNPPQIIRKNKQIPCHPQTRRILQIRLRHRTKLFNIQRPFPCLLISHKDLVKKLPCILQQLFLFSLPANSPQCPKITRRSILRTPRSQQIVFKTQKYSRRQLLKTQKFHIRKLLQTMQHTAARMLRRELKQIAQIFCMCHNKLF